MENKIVECACGCGEKFEKYDKQGRPREFLFKHHKSKTPEATIKDNIKIDKNGCWIWQNYKDKNGYGQLKYKCKSYLSHRFSYETFKNENIDNKIICHKCNNSSCVNPDHLYAGSQHDNVQDMVFRGTARFDITFSDEDISEMRKMYKTGKYKRKQIREIFKISSGYLCRILNNKRRPELSLKNLKEVFNC